MKVRAGVVGLGMGKNHARAYDGSPLADLTALCDLDEERLSRYQELYPQAHAYADYEEMFAESGIDAVSVALPNCLHAPVTVAALKQGLHVLCEKPMALNAKQAEEMLRVSCETGKKLMIHLNYRFSRECRFLKRYVEEGHLGQVYYARTRWLRARGVPKMGSWFGIKEQSGGGPLIDLGVHRLDLAMWLMGYPKVLSVSASTFGLLGARIGGQAGARYDVEDLATALIRLDNGATLNLEVSWAGGTDKQEDMLTGIYGTEGAAIHRNLGEGYEFEALALREEAGAFVAVNPRVYPKECPSPIEHFLQCIIDDRPPEASAEDGLAMMRILDAIYRSAELGREVWLEE